VIDVGHHQVESHLRAEGREEIEHRDRVGPAAHCEQSTARLGEELLVENVGSEPLKEIPHHP
jgi:hypothetical protein